MGQSKKIRDWEEYYLKRELENLVSLREQKEYEQKMNYDKQGTIKRIIRKV